MIRQRTIRGRSRRTCSGLMLVTVLGATSCSDRPLLGEPELDGSTGDPTTTGTSTSSPGASDGPSEPESTGGIGGDATTAASETTGSLMPPEPPALVLTLSPIKRFDLTWGLVEGADHYRLLESVSPDAPFVPLVEDIVADSISLTVPLHLRFGARYVLQACNAVGCTDSEAVVVDGTMVEAVGYVKGDGIPGAYFGYGLALSSDGTVMAVGTDSGAVFMLTQDAEGTWATAQVLESSVGSLALSADGNVLVAGGEAHTFERDRSGQWVPRGGVIPAVGRLVLSADGSTLVISRSQGQVVVLEREPAGDWSERASFEREPGEPWGLLGIALSADGSTLAMGNWTTEVVVRDAAGSWSQQGLFEAHPDTSVEPGSSMALSADGSTLVVGATAAQSVPVFERNAAGEWTEHARIEIPYALEKELGGSVVLDGSGELLVIGAIADASNAVGIGGDETNASVARAGATYVFARDATSGEWLQRAYVKAPNTDWGDLFGLRVALSGDGNVLAVAAPYEDGSSAGFGGDPADDSSIGAGAVYLY